MTTPCAGDQCQDQKSSAPNLSSPSGGVSDGHAGDEATPAFSLRSVSAAQRKALAATGKIRLTVTANVPGTIGVKATAPIGGRSVTVGSAGRTLRASGRVTVTLSLSKKARAQLASRGRLAVRVAVTHSRVALDRSVTLRLAHAKAKSKKSTARSSAQRGSVHRLGVGASGGRS